MNNNKNHKDDNSSHATCQGKQNDPNTNKISKANMSLVMKLNLHATLRTLGVFIILNCVLTITILGFTLWDIEKEGILLYQQENPSNKTLMSYQFVQQHYGNQGIRIWSGLNRFTPLSNHQVSRYFGFDIEKKHSISSLYYRLDLYDESTSIIYPIGDKFMQYRYPAYGLLLVELLLLVRGARKGRKRIRRILKPLTEMAKQAQTITSASGGELKTDEMERLRDLAGTISNIDATKLDKRLSVDSNQIELKDLATAINSMLNRIDEAYRAQVRFVSDASHELRTPISVIQGYVNLLDRWGKNDETTLQESIDAIKSESENMKELIEQLLFLARGDNETLHINLENFDSNTVVEEVIKETRLLDTLHIFRIQSEGPIYLYADRQLMKQALRILIDNSIKYSPDEGEIVVKISKDDCWVMISVQDNGIGIDSENLPYIFDRFYRSDESRARKTGGSGLGLSIMKWIIDRHNGTIEVISRKGIGTRTTFKLPKSNH